VNDTISTEAWNQKLGTTEPITYAEANAVLFEAMEFVAEQGGQISEVELSILRILEALKNKRFIRWEEAVFVQKDIGLESFLEQHNPDLRHEN
jgi:hypothetical protein